MGTWEYRLILNGMDIGSATVINEEKESQYLSTITMNMSVGNVQNSSKQIVTETRSFEPVKLEIYNRIINGKDVQEINTIASFKGKEITVTSERPPPQLPSMAPLSWTEISSSRR
jgi:hypothetical protein